MNTDVAQNELIEIYKRGEKISVDSNGQRLMGADDCFVLAARLIDQGMYLEEDCPLKPFGDQLVVRVVHETDRMSKGGVALLDTDSPMHIEPALRGVILGVGPTVGKRIVDGRVAEDTLIETPKVGDLILFSRHAGIETVVGDKRYLTMRVSYALTKVVLNEQTPAS